MKKIINIMIKWNKRNLEDKGITLIALVITIIVLLILAGVSVAMLTGQNGILAQAQKAKQATKESNAAEKVKIAVTAAISNANEETLNLEKLKTELNKNLIDFIDTLDFPIVTKIDGLEFIIDANGNVYNSSQLSSFTEWFDKSGNDSTKLHIGDFVSYSTGIWDENDIAKIENSGAKISVNNKLEKPSGDFQFGGFTLKNSKDNNATVYNPAYNYVKNADNNLAVTGWRIFDVSEDAITLISAGCPELFYVPKSDNSSYIGEFILTGKKNKNADSSVLKNYVPRDWSMYLNSNYYAFNAIPLSKERLDNWYCKYITKDSTTDVWKDETFRYIYGTQYESLIDNYSYFWLSNVTDANQEYLYLMRPAYMRVGGYDNNCAYGIRMLVSLSTDIKVLKTPINKINILSREQTYTYNNWSLIP